jgi:hypothetical protein
MNSLLEQTEIEKNIYKVKINFSDLKINKNEIELTMGYTENNIPAHFNELIDKVLSGAETLCKIDAGYKMVKVKYDAEQKNGIFAGQVFFSTKKIVTSKIKKAEKAAIFVCTIGPEMERWSHKLLDEGDGILSYIVDTVASVIVESATDKLHDHIGSVMKMKGLNITNRYSPGYCDWEVPEQLKLFSMLPEKFCGITLTESAMMVPIKSVSGIIGIGAEVKWQKYACDTCGITDCTYRIIRSQHEKRNTGKTQVFN